MRSLTFLGPGELEWREADEPQMEGEGEALVRPLALATCDLDTAIIRGHVPIPGPFPYGHECVAEVIDAGEGAGVSVGEVVSVPFQISCGECDRCKLGQTGNCTVVPRMSMYGLGPLSGGEFGGFCSEVVRVPFAQSMLVPIPDGIDPAAVASLSDNIPDAWRTVAGPLAERPGAKVLIAGGAGSIATYAVQFALALGAESVDYVGGRPKDRELAARAGANLLDEEFPERAGHYAVTVDASAVHEGLTCALRSTEPEGICTSSGIYYEPSTPMPLLEMYTKGITFKTGRVHARNSMDPILELVRDGSFDPSLATVETADWDDAAEALSAHEAKMVISR